MPLFRMHALLRLEVQSRVGREVTFLKCENLAFFALRTIGRRCFTHFRPLSLLLKIAFLGGKGRDAKRGFAFEWRRVRQRRHVGVLLAARSSKRRKNAEVVLNIHTHMAPIRQRLQVRVFERRGPDIMMSCYPSLRVHVACMHARPQACLAAISDFR